MVNRSTITGPLDALSPGQLSSPTRYVAQQLFKHSLCLLLLLRLRPALLLFFHPALLFHLGLSLAFNLSLLLPLPFDFPLAVW